MSWWRKANLYHWKYLIDKYFFLSKTVINFVRIMFVNIFYLPNWCDVHSYLAISIYVKHWMIGWDSILCDSLIKNGVDRHFLAQGCILVIMHVSDVTSLKKQVNKNYTWLLIKGVQVFLVFTPHLSKLRDRAFDMVTELHKQNIDGLTLLN